MKGSCVVCTSVQLLLIAYYLIGALQLSSSQNLVNLKEVRYVLPSIIETYMKSCLAPFCSSLLRFTIISLILDTAALYSMISSIHISLLLYILTIGTSSRFMLIVLVNYSQPGCLKEAKVQVLV
jgi:hypothetical protein